MDSDRHPHQQQAAIQLLSKHPLQRFAAPSRNSSLLLHGIGLSSFSYSFYYLLAYPNAISEAYGWHFQFLTIIGLSLATVTFIIAFLADVTLSRRLFAIKNAMATAAAPLELLISLLYWGLRLIDPQLVKPENMPIPPLYADLSFHLNPTLLLLLDILLLSPPWTISALPAMALSSAIAIGYWFWIEHCHAKNGFYPYPIFEGGLGMRVGLFVGSAVVMALGTFLMEGLYTVVNGKTPDSRVSRMNGAMNGGAKKGQ
ncbi:MAG: hypothetical protein Q9159_000810 [Coniocarpon cinnabarinum]